MTQRFKNILDLNIMQAILSDCMKISVQEALLGLYCMPEMGVEKRFLVLFFSVKDLTIQCIFNSINNHFFAA